MAWLEQRPGGNYLVVFRFQGTRFARSLKTKSEVEANGRLARLEDTIRLVEAGRILIPDTCADIAGFLLSDGQMATPQRQRKRVTLREVFDRYIDGLPKDSYETSTLRFTQFKMNVLGRIIGEKTPLASITKSQLQTFVNRRSQETGKHGRLLHPSTIRSDLRVLSVVWAYARDEDLVDAEFPGRRLRLPKAVAKLPFQTMAQIRTILDSRPHTDEEKKEAWQRVFLTVEEIERLLDHVEQTAKYPFLYGMFVMASHTGARRSEMLRSQRDDVSVTAKLMAIREKKRVRHRQSIRTVPMSTRLQEAFSEWFKQHPGGSFTFQAAEHLQYSNKSRKIGDAMTVDEAHHYFKGVIADSEWSELPGWHCLRHSFISNCAAKGIDQRTIMSWVGHMTAEMQERYRHMIPAQMQSELKQVFG